VDRASLAVSLSLALAVSLAASAGEPAPQAPVLLRMQAALDIDREGRVTQVEFVDKLAVPDVIRQRAQKVASGWQFQPPMKDGKAVSGRTYAGVQACVAPDAEGLDVSYAFGGNGPASFYLKPNKPSSMALPVATLQRKGIKHLQGKVTYVVGVGGRAKLESATLDEPEMQAQFGEMWKRDQREMLRYARYLPEMVDGVAIPTRLEYTSTVQWAASMDAVRDQIQKTNEQSDACRMLRGEDSERIASDSPFKRTEG
jgi:hypothetical protein